MQQVLVEANNTSSNFPPARLPAGETQPLGAWSRVLFLEHTSFEQAHQMLEAFKRVKFGRLFGCQCAFPMLLEEHIQPLLLRGGEPKSQHPLYIRAVGQKIEQCVVHRMGIEGFHHTFPYEGLWIVYETLSHGKRGGIIPPHSRSRGVCSWLAPASFQLVFMRVSVRYKGLCIHI